MAGSKIRADYEQLKAAAGQFGGQAQAAQQTVQALQKALAVLEGGDWVGVGASAFYQEMGGQVMPAMRRLAAAFESARQTTTQISQVMAQAEADAARVLRGEGGAGQSALAGGVAAPAPGDGAGGAAGGAGGGGGAGGAGGVAGVAAPPLSKGPLADAVGRMVAQDQAAVARMLAGKFSPDVIATVQKSPTLSAQIAALEQRKFTIATGPLAGGSNTLGPVITIAQPRSTERIAASIAHEVGHATFGMEDLPADMPWTRENFVQKSVDLSLRDEGRAQFNGAQVRAEVRAAGGPDIGISGTQTPAFQKVYDDFGAGKISHEQAVNQMATLMGNERASGTHDTPYRDYYREQYDLIWDKYYDNPPPPPEEALMSTETVNQFVERLAQARPLAAERFAALLGAPPKAGDSNPFWQGYTFDLAEGPFARGELRLDTNGSGALLILEPRVPPGLGEADVDRAALGPPLRIRPNPDIPPEGVTTETYQVGQAQVALQWTSRTWRLHGLVLEWKPPAAQ